MEFLEMINNGRQVMKAWGSPDWLNDVLMALAKCELKAAWMGGAGNRYLNVVLEVKTPDVEKPPQIQLIVQIDDVLTLLPGDAISSLPDPIRVLIEAELEARG